MTTEALGPLRYHARAINGDYARAGVGLALTLGPLLATGATGAAAYVLGVLAALFFVFGLRTWHRHRMTVHVDDQGVSTHGIWRATVRWQAVTRVKLSYFSTRRDRQKGWMQLMLRGDGATIRLDSELGDFDAVVGHTAHMLNARGLAVSEASAANFASYGHIVAAAGPRGATSDSEEAE